MAILGVLISGWGFLLLDMIDLKRAELAIHGVGNSDRITSSLYLVCIVETWDLGKLLPSLDQIVDVIDSLYTLLLLPLSIIQSLFALLLIFFIVHASILSLPMGCCHCGLLY